MVTVASGAEPLSCGRTPTLSACADTRPRLNASSKHSAAARSGPTARARFTGSCGSGSSALGSHEPPRVLIRFLGDEFEGREEWVPPNRLKVPWAEVDDFRAAETRWAAVKAESRVTEGEDSAAGIVFDKLVNSKVASVIYNVDGVVRIHDVDVLAESLDIDAKTMRSDPVSFVEDGDLVSPWSITELIARRACELDPEPILSYVANEEAKAAEEATYGRWYRATRSYPGFEVSPEDCFKSDEEFGRPVREVLRRWCGQKAVARRDELAALRTEVRRIGRPTEAAIRALRPGLSASPYSNLVTLAMRPASGSVARWLTERSSAPEAS